MNARPSALPVSPIADTPRPADHAGRPPAPLRLLLVGDDPLERLALQRFVAEHRLPYALAEAHSVAETRVLLRDGAYDALLVEHRLPDGSGFDVLADAGDIPVILVTDSGSPALAVRAIRAGAADYLPRDPGREYLGLLPHKLNHVMQERRLQAGLRVAQDQLHQLLEFLPVATVAFDAEGRVSFYNRRARSLWGRAPHIGEPAGRFCGGMHLYESDGTPAEPDACWRALQSGHAVLGHELRIEDALGRNRHVLAYGNPLLGNARRMEGAIVVWIDVTERRRLESHRQALEAQLQRARRIEAIGALAGGMAHEFNNLLTAILGHLQLAELDVTDEHPARLHVEEAVRSSRRARDLVSHILTFSDQTRVHRSPGSLAPAVEEAGRCLRACLPANIALGVSLGECPPVAADTEEIGGIIMELGLGAIQAMQETGGRLQITLGRVPPTEEFRILHPLVEPHHTVRLTIHEAGPQEDGAPGSRAEPSWQAHSPGADAGLAGIRAAMKRLHGAAVEEASAAGGALVHLLFPEASRLS